MAAKKKSTFSKIALRDKAAQDARILKKKTKTAAKKKKSSKKKS